MPRKEIDLNNFHGFFPTGMYRHPILQKGKERIIADLDNLIQKHGFDQAAFESERDLRSAKLERAVTLFQLHRQETPEVKKMIKEGAEHTKKIRKMIYPFYEKLLEMGHSHTDLTA